MDNYDLITAIGCAEDTYLTEIEQTKIHRLPRHFGLVAALIALLLTACAAPMIAKSFDKVNTAVRSDTGNGCDVYVLVNGSRHWKYEGFRSHDAEVNVSVNPDAPQQIETYYFPEKLLDYCTPEACESTETSLTMQFSTKVPRYGTVYGIVYQQHALPENGNVTVPNILGNDALEQERRTYADIDALIFHGSVTYTNSKNGKPVTKDTVTGRVYTQILFWSDGYYLYCLKLPITYNLPIAAVEEIVTSLTPVEDISQYLNAE